MPDRTSAFAPLFVAAYIGHQFGDHVIQTDDQAGGKQKPGSSGWAANLRHVASYHAAVAVTVATTVRVTRAPVSGRGLLAGLALSAGSHALIDRGWLPERIMAATGSPGWAAMTIKTDPDGAPWRPGVNRADQALHVGCLWAGALLATWLSEKSTRGAAGSPAREAGRV
ncbi:DUF3307 domain-containing protein [Parafrankia sp. FMc2]|uniref:DUF3307 domain-containing protein n=1 Tax=Parafrankia sp. FMc2 TaxID=3233196 RepID=UPI0034D68AFE